MVPLLSPLHGTYHIRIRLIPVHYISIWDNVISGAWCCPYLSVLHNSKKHTLGSGASRGDPDPASMGVR